MDQLLPWLTLIPAVALGVLGSFLVRSRGASWDLSAAGGALLGGATYGLVLLIGSVIYARIVYR